MLNAASKWVNHNGIWSQKTAPWLRRCLATLSDTHGSLNPGENIHGFLVKRRKHVPELELTAYNFEHGKTGAEYLHVAREDQNNVFSVGFKTNPPDDTGVPHILEHTTLCGSHKQVEISPSTRKR